MYAPGCAGRDLSCHLRVCSIRTDTKTLSEVAKGMFTLIKPNIDVNTARFENGKKGGRKRNLALLPPKMTIL